MTIMNMRYSYLTDINPTFRYGEISLRLWNSFFTTRTTSGEVGYGVKSSYNLFCDGYSTMYTRPGTLSIDTNDLPSSEAIVIGLDQYTFAVVTNKIVIYGMDTGSRQVINQRLEWDGSNLVNVFHKSKNEYYLLLNNIWSLTRTYKGFDLKEISPGLNGGVWTPTLGDITIHGNQVDLVITGTMKEIKDNIAILLQPSYQTNAIVSPLEISSGYHITSMSNIMTHDSSLQAKASHLTDKVTGDVYTTAEFAMEVTQVITAYIIPVQENAPFVFDLVMDTGITPGYAPIDANDLMAYTKYIQLGKRPSAHPDTSIVYTLYMTLEGPADKRNIKGTPDSALAIHKNEAVEFFMQRLFIASEGSLYFSEVGEKTIKTGTTNIIHVPGMGKVISMRTIGSTLFFSDGVILYTLKYMYNTQTPITWSLSTASELHIVNNGILSIKGRVIIVAEDGIYEYSYGAFGQSRETYNVITLSIYNEHFFSADISNVLTSYETGVFYVFRQNKSVIRFVLQDTYVAGTTINYGDIGSPLNYGGIFCATVTNVGNKQSINWHPKYYLDSHNEAVGSSELLYFPQIHCFLDSARYRTTSTIMRFSTVKGNVLSGKEKFNLPHVNIPPVFFPLADDIKAGDTIYYIADDKTIKRCLVESVTDGNLTISSSIPTSFGSTVSVLGKELHLDTEFGNAIEPYVNEKNVYVSVDKGNGTEIYKYKKSDEKYYKGLTICIGIGYNCYCNIIHGASVDEQHQKLSGYINTFHTQKIRVTVSYTNEEREADVHMESLMANAYRLRLPSISSYTGASPNIKISFFIGQFGCVNKLSFILQKG